MTQPESNFFQTINSAVDRTLFESSGGNSRTLRGLFVLFTAVVIGIALYLVFFFASYPLENEWREGSLWLHYTASRAGVDIYDYNKVAFTNMNHGPLNEPLKNFARSVLGLEDGRWVTRVYVLLFPFVLILGSIVFVRRRRDVVPALLLGATTYLVLITHRDGTTLMNGRSDALAHTLSVFFAIAVWANVRSRFSAGQWLSSAAAGGVAAMIFLSNWRSMPFAVFVAAVWLAYRSKDGKVRDACVVVLAFVGTVLASIGWVLKFDFFKFYLHFFAFFNPYYGWGASVVPPLMIVRRLITFIPQFLLMAVSLRLLLAGKSEHLQSPLWRKVWIYGILVLTLILCAGFIVNSGGGHLAYMNFSFLGIWFLGSVILNGNNNERGAGTVVTACAVALLVAALSYVVYLAPRVNQMSAARERDNRLLALLREADARYSVVSEDVFLFRRKYHGEIIDMGDVASALVSKNRFPAAFIERTNSHFASLESKPPDLIVTVGFCSLELKKLAEEKYNEIYVDALAKGKRPWGLENVPVFRVFARKDLPQSELLNEISKLK